MDLSAHTPMLAYPMHWVGMIRPPQLVGGYVEEGLVNIVGGMLWLHTGPYSSHCKGRRRQSANVHCLRLNLKCA